MKKRILSLLLASTVLIGLVPLMGVTASAADDLIWPCESGWYVTCMYYYKDGSQHSTRYGYKTSMDIAGGGNILAVESGVVETATDLGNRSFGRYVVIKHPSGNRSLYAHLNSYNVSVGQSVTKGQKIGVMGTTGGSSGVHLHFEYSGGDPWKLFFNAKYMDKIIFEQNVRSNNATYNSDKTVVNVIDQYYYKSGTYYYYNGQAHTHSYTGSYYEADHPHKVFKKCSCGATEYTGGTQVVDTCAICVFNKDVSIAQNKSYTISGNGVGHSNYTAKLTDNVASTKLTYDNNWFAFYYNQSADASAVNAPNGIGSFVVDLGKFYDVSQVKMNMINNNGSGIMPPKAINIYLSENGKDFTKASSVASISQDQNVSYICKADVTGLARFVKVEFELAGMFAFVNEIKVMGTESAYVPDPDVGENIAKGKDYVISGNGVGFSSYTANLTDGNANATLTYDNNWFAFYYNSKNADSSTSNAPGGIGSAVIDLGGFYDLTEVKVNMANNVQSGIAPPKSINIYTSENGKDFKKVGTIATISNVENVAYVCKTNVTGVARYVKVEVELNSTFAFLNEIKVFGTKSDYVPETPVEPEIPEVKLGDVNVDGAVDSIDYLYVKRAALKTYNLSDKERLAADINNDDVIDSVDYLLVKRIALGTYSPEQ